MKHIYLTVLTLFLSFASFAITPITGTSYTCLGTNGHLTDSLTSGGTWSSSNTTVATVAGVTGSSCTVYGVSTGTTTITYTLSSGYATMTYTVYPAGPAAITGTTTLCAGSTTGLSDATPGGTWSSGSPSVATVSATGIVYGVATGTVYIYYSTGTGPCTSVSAAVTINGTTTGTITGPLVVCVGSSITEADSVGGPITGTWSSSNTSIATVVSTTGIHASVTGVSAGTVIITFTASGTCGTAFTTFTITVSNTTTTPVISGATTVSTGGTANVFGSPGGGSWSSSNTSVATIGPLNGVVTGGSPGTAIITYSYTGCGGVATNTHTITVTAINGISGRVYFPGGAYTGNVKVWLITYNTGTFDLEAADSLSLYCFDSIVYYQFLGMVTDSYRVKAAAIDPVYGLSGIDTFLITTGYVPTYHTSSFYWYSANVLYHVSGTADIYEDINMLSGTLTSGPGFIAGNVTTGANKGTTTSVPVVGLSVILLNSATNQIMQSTTTNISGHYSFSNLPVGATYYVFPDSLNYMTTQYPTITLTSASSSMSLANFTQHTLSKTITPNNVSVNNVGSYVSSLFVFPNPSNGKLNLQWQEIASEKGNVTISDITGREIYRTVINMNEGTGVKQIDLSGFANGLYMITVKSGTINYNNKIQIQK